MFDIISKLNRSYMLSLASENRRVDGRSWNEYRKILIDAGCIKKAEGSARVMLGNTQVLVGIKMDVGEPYPDSPDMGVITTSAELVPLASPTFEPGPPDENSIELARVVDRGIRESEAIDLEALCIEEGEKVWIVFIDIHVLDMYGNLIDASSLAAISALLNTEIPKYEDGKVIHEEKDGKLPVREKPITITTAKIGDMFVVDPTYEEELAMDARLSVAVKEDETICAMQKGESGFMSEEDIMRIIDLSIEKSKELRRYIPGD